MGLRKILISVFCIAMAMTFSTTAIAGSGAIEMTFDRSRPESTLNESAAGGTWFNCASIKIKRVPQNGFVVVTASGNASFENEGQMLKLTLSDEGVEEGPMTWFVTPGQLLEQSWCVRWVFPVSKNARPTFYLNGSYDELLLAEEGDDVFVKTGSMTAEFYKRNKVDKVEP